jgi:hypothetical protein
LIAAACPDALAHSARGTWFAPAHEQKEAADKLADVEQMTARVARLIRGLGRDRSRSVAHIDRGLARVAARRARAVIGYGVSKPR